MKLFIQRLTLLASIALLAVACDLQQTFDERIDDKQLLVLAPDFADTSVQLVFRDPETLAVIDEDFEVTVHANKRLIDANGNYKNEFIARGGVMEFSVSPEETVSESDPLQIVVLATNSDSTKVVLDTELIYKTKGAHSSLIAPTNIASEDELSDDSSSASILNKSNSVDALAGSAEDISLRLEFNDREIPTGNIMINGVRIYNYTSAFGGIGSRRRYLIYSTATSLNPVDVFAWNPDGVTERDRLLDEMTISVKGIGRELVDYELEIAFFNSNDKDRIYYNINQNGNYEFERRSLKEGKYVEITNNAGFFANYSHEVKIPKSVFFGGVSLEYWRNFYYKRCTDGFNLNFVGAPSDSELNLIYKATRNTDDKIFAIASFNISSASNQYNSLQDGGNNQHVIAVEGNTLEFAENSQYIIEPSVIELGGEELCGNTYTVTLKRRDTHKMHNINLSMRNENQNVGVALTFSALLRKQGQSDAAWETVNFKQGSTSVYLEEGSTYEVKLTLADEPFEFTFTNDLSLVEAAVQATKRNVTRIKDITYTIEQTADSNTIDAEIVFFEGQSLID